MITLSKPAVMTAVLSISVLLIAAPIAAHQGATGIVKDRMEMMKGFGDAAKAMAPMVLGKKPYDAEKMKVLAQKIREGAGQHMVDMFPEGSLDKPTDAKPVIWREWEKFKDLAHRLEEGAASLMFVAEDQALAKQAFARLGNTCKDCHETFREKKGR